MVDYELEWAQVLLDPTGYPLYVATNVQFVHGTVRVR